ncbi:myo-inositol-1(or 4)-monophosphatase [Micromonospora phaseoli]|uniref:inositol-phosphate phosphatase n=1 Tax=Micromonospora phaseoli TaxID=1144548 RepID=A0A1H7DSW7_9ACTN|nr:inositol monophosphatase family protein [Micromonospora phaseoli]PZV99194.1 myo-inositol-1(or 4)-monophosphatase [Micromonospora phaseoli]GIJ80010.1 putative inositol-1-monophosphatase SuhB [Micromonospora phaseoli]SEK04861.1 myo-inositol-1(or 4)-monophosphatase [Micromonospora phaseoli]
MSTGAAPSDLQRLSLRAARAGAEAIRDVCGQGVELTYKDGAAQDPVTTADQASERAILDLIARDRPQDAVLAEESGFMTGCSGLRWIVDPLDGTLNFSHGLSRYAVSIAVAADRRDTDSPDGSAPGAADRVVAATILQPATGTCLVLGDDGAHNGSESPLTVKPQAVPEHALVAFAVPNAPGPRRQAYQLLTLVAPRVADLRNTGSTVCDLATVATGELDAFVSFDPAPWDIAAGAALVEAAGGVSRRWRRGERVVFATGAPAVVAALADWLGAADEEGM